MAPSVIKLTAKRQATFPGHVCEELGVQPGDTMRIEKRVLEGQPVWVLVPTKHDTSWFGSLRRYGVGKDHRMSAIWKSVAHGHQERER